MATDLLEARHRLVLGGGQLSLERLEIWRLKITDEKFKNGQNWDCKENRDDLPWRPRSSTRPESSVTLTNLDPKID